MTAETTETKTLDQIVAELRSLMKGAELSIHPRDDLPTVFGKPLMVYFADLADQIEATAKRAYNEVDHAVCAIEEAKKESAVGNMAAMREALESYVEYSELVCQMGIFTRDRLVEITTRARVALSAPPSQDEVITEDRKSAI